MTYALGHGTGPLKGVRVVEIAGIGPGPTPRRSSPTWART